MPSSPCNPSSSWFWSFSATVRWKGPSFGASLARASACPRLGMRSLEQVIPWRPGRIPGTVALPLRQLLPSPEAHKTVFAWWYYRLESSRSLCCVRTPVGSFVAMGRSRQVSHSGGGISGSWGAHAGFWTGSTTTPRSMDERPGWWVVTGKPKAAGTAGSCAGGSPDWIG